VPATQQVVSGDEASVATRVVVLGQRAWPRWQPTPWAGPKMPVAPRRPSGLADVRKTRATPPHVCLCRAQSRSVRRTDQAGAVSGDRGASRHPCDYDCSAMIRRSAASQLTVGSALITFLT
jgi:hypothetical protein